MIEPIKDHSVYDLYLHRIDKLIEQCPVPDSPESDELEALCFLVELYEEENFPIGGDN